MKWKEIAGNSCGLISGTTPAFVYRHCGNPEIFHLVHHYLDQKLAQDLLHMKDCYSFWLNWLVKITLNPLKDSPPLDWYKTRWCPDNILDVVKNKRNVQIHLSSYQTLTTQCTRRQFTHKNNSHPCLLLPWRHLKWVGV